MKINHDKLYAEQLKLIVRACVIGDPKLAGNVDDLDFFFGETERRTRLGVKVWIREFPRFDVEKVLDGFELCLRGLDVAFGGVDHGSLRKKPADFPRELMRTWRDQLLR